MSDLFCFFYFKISHNELKYKQGGENGKLKNVKKITKVISKSFG